MYAAMRGIVVLNWVRKVLLLSIGVLLREEGAEDLLSVMVVPFSMSSCGIIVSGNSESFISSLL
jgi:hypothetical protein